MAILKSPPKPPKNETLQIRIEEETKSKLEKYAEFIDGSESYVVSEALKLIFRKDDEFKAWVENRSNNGHEPKNVTDSLFETAKEAAGAKHSQQPSDTQDGAIVEKELSRVGASDRQRLR